MEYVSAIDTRVNTHDKPRMNRRCVAHSSWNFESFIHRANVFNLSFVGVRAVQLINPEHILEIVQGSCASEYPSKPGTITSSQTHRIVATRLFSCGNDIAAYLFALFYYSRVAF